MNVLQILPDLNAGGVERTVLETVEALRAGGHGAHVLSAGGRLVPKLEALGGIHHTGQIGSKNILTVPWRIAGVRRLIAEQKIDIVHARSRAPAWPAYYAARAENTPFVTTYHGIYNAKSALKRTYNSIMAKGDIVIANSHYTADHILREHGIDPDRITVIPRGVDMTLFDPNVFSSEDRREKRAHWGVPENKILILLPGRLTRWKGQTVALESLSHLDPKFHLVLLGDAQGRDAYVTELKALSKQYEIEGRVYFPGHDETVASAYYAADIVICPSTDPEAFGRTAAEAQAMSRPVIVSDHGGAVEVVDHGTAGWRVPPGDAMALANAITRIDDLSDLAGARTRISERFSKTALQSALLEVYSNVSKA
jgi:glycosyltransferase involved in cell wall biosynthesis